jgi:hypothetical protein
MVHLDKARHIAQHLLELTESKCFAEEATLVSVCRAVEEPQAFEYSTSGWHGVELRFCTTDRLWYAEGSKSKHTPL